MLEFQERPLIFKLDWTFDFTRFMIIKGFNLILYSNDKQPLSVKFFSIVLLLCVFTSLATGQETKDSTAKTKQEQDKLPPKVKSQKTDASKAAKNPARDQDKKPNKLVSKPSQGKLFSVFLTTGKSTNTFKKEELEKMQADQLANFRRLMEEGKLLTAGRITDPEGTMQVIAILKANQVSDLAGMFKPDPYIQNGILNIETCEMKFELGQIRTKLIPQGMDEYRIVVLEKDTDSKTEMDDELAAETLKYLKGEYTNKSLNLSLKLFGDKTLCRQILIFKKTDPESTIADIVAAIPAVKQGVWKQKTMVLYMGKGSIARDDE